MKVIGDCRRLLCPDGKKSIVAVFGVFWIFGLCLLSAQETSRQYLSGEDGEHTVPWDFSCSSGRNSGKEATIGVPSCWECQGFGTFHYGFDDKKTDPVIGTYRHSFDVPPDWQGKRIFIVFDGVMTDAAVTINGSPAGPVHQGAFYRFKYDITDLIKLNGKNDLEVTVSNRSANASINEAERNADFWVFGGIFRPVWLQAEPAQFVEHVAIDARADGSFTMAYVLGGKGDADTVEVSLEDAQGKPVGASSAAVGAGHLGTTVASPALWSAETPVLYTAVVSLKQGNVVLHRLKQRFGFRTIEVRPKDGIYVNGQRILFKGVCHHVAWPTLGRSSSPRIAALDVDLIQEMNMNAVRMSHYPPDEEFLDLCDERGLYVLDELTGWQHKYDTNAGRPLVQEMVERDVNHPSIVMWDNGNEGGWNTELDGDFDAWDPQHRPVIHPGGHLGEIDAGHYPDYAGLTKRLAGHAIVLPTEFLHGLYDGGLGSGLEDYWKAMLGSPVSAGGFFWSFADEGVQRVDEDNRMDVNGNFAPDGILGPYREKEASFYTIKEIWSPLQLPDDLPTDFDGTLKVENHYNFTNAAQCRVSWKLLHLDLAAGTKTVAEGVAPGPDLRPGDSGTAHLDLPPDWRLADALAVTALSPLGKELWTWTWPLQPSTQFVPKGEAVATASAESASALKMGDTEVQTEAATGRLLGVNVAGKKFSLSSDAISNAKWSMLDSGWLRLDYSLVPTASGEPAEISFSYPEAQMVEKTWVGDGPYRVWRNRLKGQTFGLWTTKYNETETGYKDWIYPEFAGFFAKVRCLKLTTTEGVLTIVLPNEGDFIRMGTPHFPPEKLSGNTNLPVSSGNVVISRDLPAMGDKFHAARLSGPQATSPLVSGPSTGTLYLHFDQLP